MLKMASSPDSVEERRRLQGRVRTDTETAKMRMSEPEEDKVTVTGGGLRASWSGRDYKEE